MTETKAEDKYLIQIILFSFSFFFSFHVDIQALLNGQGLKLFEQALDSGMDSSSSLRPSPPPAQHPSWSEPRLHRKGRGSAGGQRDWPRRGWRPLRL